MIDAKELTQDCHVSFAGDRATVEDIDYFRGRVSLGINCANQRILVLPKSLEPIPITEELLEEISAGKHEKSDKHGDYFVCVWTIGEYQIEFRIIGDRNIVAIRDYAEPQTLIAESMNVRYLHELEVFVYLTTKQKLL